MVVELEGEVVVVEEVEVKDEGLLENEEWEKQVVMETVARRWR